jgi:DNA-binding MarR family transcriptional regulator
MTSSQDFIDRSHAERQKAGRGIPLADTSNLARVTRLAAHLERSLAEISGNAGLKPAQFQVLAELLGRDPAAMTVSDLARAVVLTSGAMTPLLDRLDERGLIHRQTDPEDRRSRRITITEKGRSLIARALDRQVTRHRSLNSVLSAEERAALSDILRKLLIAVEGEAA